jgi:hypothetical protein
MNNRGVVEISLPFYYFSKMIKRNKTNCSKEKYYKRYFLRFFSNMIPRRVTTEGEE